MRYRELKRRAGEQDKNVEFTEKKGVKKYSRVQRRSSHIPFSKNSQAFLWHSAFQAGSVGRSVGGGGGSSADGRAQLPSRYA